MQTYPSTPSFGVDDDSVMHKLVDELDLHSAMHRLLRVGFVHEVQLSPTAYRFVRRHGSETERLMLAVDEDKHFVVHIAFKEQEYSELISTWDQWIDFVRMLILRWILSVQRGGRIHEVEVGRM